MAFLPMTRGGGNEVNLNYDNCVIFPGNYTSSSANIAASGTASVSIAKPARLILWSFSSGGDSSTVYSMVRSLALWDTEKKQGVWHNTSSGSYTSNAITTSNLSNYVPTINDTTITFKNPFGLKANMTVIVYYK